MKSWPLQDAKARLSELIDTCLEDGPQLVTRRGKDTAVVIPIDDWVRLQPFMRPSKKRVLIDEGPKGELPLPPRGRFRRRPPPSL